jgi:hypothetical protein
MVVWNERIKLLANFLNGTAVAMIALGILAPIANMLFRADAQSNTQTNVDLLIWWGFSAVILHGLAAWVLEDLQE